MGIFGGGDDPKIKIRKYYISWISALTLGHIDSIKKIYIDELEVWTKPDNFDMTKPFYLNKSDLFGGLKQGGGFTGTVIINNNGGNTYSYNKYIVKYIEKHKFFHKHHYKVPVYANSQALKYNGITTVVFDNCYIGTSPYLKPVSMHCQRILTHTDGSPQWLAGYAKIGDDMNPIHIIREILTSKLDWGLGIDESMIDDNSFSEAAKFMFDDNWGLSYLFDKNDNANDFIKTVCDESGIILHRDLITNKFKIVIMRKEYDFTKLPVLTETDIKKINNYNKTELSEQPTQLNIRYWDRDLNKNSTIIVTNDRLTMLTGINNVKDISYKGVCTRTQAVRNGSFDMSIYSNPLSKLEITCNRNALRYDIGDLIRVKVNSHNIEDVAYRILKMKFDPMLESITLTLQQDIYSHTSRQLALTSNTTPSISQPNPPYYYNIEECCLMDYISLLNIIDNDISPEKVSQSIFKAVSINVSQYDTFKIKDSSDHILSEFKSSFGAELIKDVSITDTVLEITPIGVWKNIIELNSIIQCNDEIMQIVDFDSQNNNRITVKRGLWDTVPRQHSNGDFITCKKNSMLVNSTYLTYGETKLLKASVNNNISSSVITLPDTTINTKLRAKCAISPANVKINNNYQITNVDRRFTITFAKREYNSTDYFDPRSISTQYKYFAEIIEKDTGNKLIWDLEKEHIVAINSIPVTLPAGDIYLDWESTKKQLLIKVIAYRAGETKIDETGVDLTTRSYYDTEIVTIY